MWHPDPDRLALAALPAEHRDEQVDAHVTGCPLCRRHVETLRHTVDLVLAGGGDAFDDSDRPPDRIWRAITEELEIVDEPAWPRPVPAAPPSSVPAVRRPSRWRRLAVPVAAAVVGVAAGLGVGIAVTRAPAADGPVVAQLAPVNGNDPGGSGTVEVVRRAGTRAMLVRLDGVTAAAGGDYLEAWLMDPSGTRLVSLGALAPEGGGYVGEFTVPADLPMQEFRVVDISAEKWDGDEKHSRLSLLRGTVT